MKGLFLGLLEISPAIVGGALANLLSDVPRQSAAVSSLNDQEVSFWSNVYLCIGLSPTTVGQHVNIPG
jgi:hypothetical protein